MFGWELPPYNSGGLGTASLGLTQGLAESGVDLDFVLPEAGPFLYDHMRIHPLPLGSALPQPYASALGKASQYSKWYSSASANLNLPPSDIIHTNDWMTYQAGTEAKQRALREGTVVPLVAHVHATEFDRAGMEGDRSIYAMERTGLTEADHVVAVSAYTAEIVRKRYGVPSKKISVVHNGVVSVPHSKRKKAGKTVLFMGRMTYQKGPEYFLEMAKLILKKDPVVRFIMVGSGDQEASTIELAAKMGLAGSVLFSSFLRGEDVSAAYRAADLFVMPSVSEPFGLVALEALQHGTPAIVSKQSGVAEVSGTLIQVDFWDSARMAEIALEVLNSPRRAAALAKQGQHDVSRLSWVKSAKAVNQIYQSLIPIRPTGLVYA